MYSLLVARLKTKSGKTIGYRLKASNGSTFDIDISEASNYKVINATLDKNNIFRAKAGRKIGSIIVEDNGVTINKRKTHMVGKPYAIYNFSFGVLSGTQKKLLNLLESRDYIEIDKKRNSIKINMKDLSAMTATTGLEYALFERSDRYIVFKGNKTSVFISNDMLALLVNRKFNWMGHTHPGNTDLCMVPSNGDMLLLRALGQKQSVIYNSVGSFHTFGDDEL